MLLSLVHPMTTPPHAMIAVALGGAMVPRGGAGVLLVIGACCAASPDLDLLTPALGGTHEFHRTVTHSIAFAIVYWRRGHRSVR